jgi:hypothetical protein
MEGSAVQIYYECVMIWFLYYCAHLLIGTQLYQQISGYQLLPDAFLLLEHSVLFQIYRN